MELKDITTSLELSIRLKELGVKQESLFTHNGGEILLRVSETQYFSKIDGVGTPAPALSYSAYTTDELLEILEDHKASTGLNIYYQNGNTLVEQLVTGEFSKGRKLPDILAKLLIHLIENKLVNI